MGIALPTICDDSQKYPKKYVIVKAKSGFGRSVRSREGFPSQVSSAGWPCHQIPTGRIVITDDQWNKME